MLPRILSSRGTSEWFLWRAYLGLLYEIALDLADKDAISCLVCCLYLSIRLYLGSFWWVILEYTCMLHENPVTFRTMAPDFQFLGTVSILHDQCFFFFRLSSYRIVNSVCCCCSDALSLCCLACCVAFSVFGVDFFVY